MSDDAKSLIANQERLASNRSNLDTWWQSIAQRVMPSDAKFTVTDDDSDVRRTDRVFTSKPITDNERFAAVMDEMLTPRSQVWHALAVEDEDLSESSQSKEYLERLNKLLFTMRYRPGANFAAQKHQGYMSVGAFGNSVLYIDEEVAKGPRYRSLHLRECFWVENHHGRIDTLYRKFNLTALQAAARAKAEGWALPEKVAQALQKDPFCTFSFLHAVKPNDDQKAGRADFQGMPFSSHLIFIDEKQVLSVGGYSTFPFSIGRYMLGPGEHYGRSPAMAAWGSIQTLNEQKKTILRAGQKEVDPPILLQEDGVLEPFNQRPGAANYGFVSADGSPLAVPLKTGANIPLGLELMGMEAQEIEEAFLVSIFKILADHPTMTATQVLEITQQKATLLAPMMGRQQSEDLGPLIEREIDILSRDTRFSWIVEEMPDEMREGLGQYKIEYRSPLARAMRAQDGVAILRTFEALPAAMAIDKNAAYVIDVPAAFRELSEINGMPAKLIRDKKKLEAIVAQAAGAEQEAQAAAMAPELSQAALNAAKAEQLRVGA